MKKRLESFPEDNQEEDSFLLVVSETKEGMRLDRFLLETERFASRHQIQKLISNHSIWVNDTPAKPSYRLKPFQKIRIKIPPPTRLELEPEPIPLNIQYEDADLLVVNKPAGMVVHPAAGHYEKTLVNALLYHCRDLSGIGGMLRPGIVHRLDKDTSGLLVVAKGDFAHIALSEQFQVHSILREYLGLVHGRLTKTEGRIEAPIGRHPKDRKKMSTRSYQGKEAVTYWKIERRFHDFTLLRFTLKTGRTHQIRVHMAEQGHPIVGDVVYGGKKARREAKAPADKGARPFKELNRLFLHAKKLGFQHPRTGRAILFSSPLPQELSGLLAALPLREPK